MGNMKFIVLAVFHWMSCQKKSWHARRGSRKVGEEEILYERLYPRQSDFPDEGDPEHTSLFPSGCCFPMQMVKRYLHY